MEFGLSRTLTRGGIESIPWCVFLVLPALVIIMVVRSGRSQGGRRFGRPGLSSRTCPRCSTVNRPVARYCANCGLRLQ